MTLKEYIDAGRSDITQFGDALGISESGVRKWMYGQREPDLATAARIQEITNGEVSIAELSKASARAAFDRSQEAA